MHDPAAREDFTDAGLENVMIRRTAANAALNEMVKR